MRNVINPLLTFLLVIVCATNSFSQKDRPEMKFGDVKVSDFSPRYYPIDSSAGAVYLFDKGNSYYEGNNHGYFSVIFERHARIRLLKKASFADIATVEFELYKNTFWSEQKLQSIEAATYNLRNGQVVTTKLDKNTIFQDRGNKKVTVKFTFPDIQEGSIIEFTYKILTPTYRLLYPWTFQDEYPRLWTEYKVEVPEILDFVFLRQGQVPFYSDTVTTGHASYAVTAMNAIETSTLNVRMNTTQHFWAIKNVPPLKTEAYTTTIDNYTERVEFQFSAFRYPEEPVVYNTHGWEQASKELMEDDDFGKQVNPYNNWLNDDVKAAVAGQSDGLDRAKAIYKYVRDNYRCTDNTGFYLSQPLKKTYTNKTGNVADINMLLAAMLQMAGFQVHPVILSTRDNGRASVTYPILERFNYTITQVTVGDDKFLLDASSRALGFGSLQDKCYNGYADVIWEENAAAINLSADSLKESQLTSVYIINDENGMGGGYSSTLGNIESMIFRNTFSKKNDIDNYFKQVKKNYLFDVAVSNGSIDSLNNPGAPVKINYDFDFKPEGDIIYVSPLMADAIKENPFVSENRSYPVEMPYCTDKTFTLNMEIPKGYKVDEIPKPARVKLNENDGMFEYIISANAERVQLRCRLTIKKANFLPEDYQGLRDFYAFIVKKEAEQIVFKKL